MLPTWLALTLSAFGAAVTLILGLWTWRRLWRHPITDRYSTVVYRHGVRGFGVLMLITMTFIAPLFGPIVRSGQALHHGVSGETSCCAPRSVSHSGSGRVTGGGASWPGSPVLDLPHPRSIATGRGVSGAGEPPSGSCAFADRLRLPAGASYFLSIGTG